MWADEAYEYGAADHLVEAAIEVFETFFDEFVEQQFHIELHVLGASGASDGDVSAVALELEAAQLLLVEGARALHLEREREHVLNRAVLRLVVVE